MLKCYVDLENHNEAINDYRKNYLEESNMDKAKILSRVLNEYGLPDLVV
ncbi:MAG TPA: hypothetical protein VIK72_00720 [Clostridiaceae bacterium]